MKKLLFIVTFLLFSRGLRSQDKDLLEQILQVNSAASSFESNLCETVIKSGEESKREGMLYFIKPDKFAAMFNDSRYMISNADRLKMNIGLFHGKFRLRKTGMMRSLSNIFLYGFQGRCVDLATENDYSIETKETDQYQQVTFNNNRRSIIGIGYRQVIYKFEKDTLKLKEIYLVDNKGTVNAYSISNVQYDVEVDPQRFEF